MGALPPYGTTTAVELIGRGMIPASSWVRRAAPPLRCAILRPPRLMTFPHAAEAPCIVGPIGSWELDKSYGG